MTKLSLIQISGRRRAAPGAGNSLLAAGVIILVLAVISCSTISHEAATLPEVPGAKYIGSSECEQCHEEIYRSFQTADHSRLIAQGTNSINVGCESCHGPCSLHSDSGGETKPPFSFTSGRPEPASLATLPECRRPGPPRRFVTNATTMFAASFNCPVIIPCPRAHELHGMPFATQGQRARRRRHRPALPG